MMMTLVEKEWYRGEKAHDGGGIGVELYRSHRLLPYPFPFTLLA